jgi:hypothetical protein
VGRQQLRSYPRIGKEAGQVKIQNILVGLMKTEQPIRKLLQAGIKS